MKKLLHRLTFPALLLFAATAFARDPNLYVFLCFGQSNMEGFPGIPDEDKTFADPRLQVLAAVDFPAMGRKQGHWYPATPPLCRPSTGVGPTDYFGRSLIAHLPANVRVGVVNVSVAGCKIELFDKDHFQSYAATAPSWMKDTIAVYGGNPYQRLVEMGRLAQKKGVIRGILLHQGESNADDREWAGKVKTIYENLLHDLGLSAKDVPLLAGELVAADQQGAVAGMNALIDDLPKIIPTAYVVSAAGCASRPDHLHFTPEGYRKLGERYAETMLPLLSQKQAKNK
ncbi:sialate O-acetylesterase [Opitutaceae bacterium EW11]|nr:sialate O-acetylesterase [Opitutaceae bacterium EW11]